MTRSPQHHPSLETLTAFAAGTQRPGFDLVTAAHVYSCPECQERTAALECVGGALLAAGESAALAPDALVSSLRRLDSPAPPAAPIRSINDVLNSAKRRWVAPGVWVAKIDTPHAAEDRVYMLGAAPGAITAKHGHAGAEYTQVLKGALSENGIIYRAGDFSERDQSHIHKPGTIGDEPCICLFATQGRLEPQSFFGRIAFALAGV